MGPSLTELDLSNSFITVQHLEILFSRITQLQSLKLSSCSLVESSCLKLITQASHRTLTELYLNNCPQIRIEPLLWLSGSVGINSKRLSRLRSLDLSYCPVEDEGLQAIGMGIKGIRYLNLEGCEMITDKSLEIVLKSNQKLLVLNCSNCYQITSKSILALASSCHSLVSLNLSRCGKINDLGINALAQSIHHLQAINFAGLRLLSEGAIFSVVQSSPGLLLMNVTGCEQVTMTGLRSLIQGLQYVIEAKTYMGFKPQDEHIEKKLSNQLFMIRDTAAQKISSAYRKMMNQREQNKLMEMIKINKSAKIIQNYLSRYMMRVRFYYKWRNRVTLGR